MAAPASSSPPSPPASTLAALPLDLLAHVLSFTPLRPRIAVISLVCKRLLHAARHSVVTGTGRARFVVNALSPALRSHLTNLTSLHVGASAADAPPVTPHWSRIRSLTLGAFQTIPLPLLTEFRSLTTLHISGAPSTGALLHFLEPHAASLTSLTLDMFVLRPVSGAHIALPHLVSLDTNWLEAMSHLRAPALTHLGAHVLPANFDVITGLPLPRLASLALTVERHTPHLLTWLRSLSLTRLALSFKYDPKADLADAYYELIAHAPALTSIQVTRARFNAALAQQTRLAHLTCTTDMLLTADKLLQCVGSNLTSLKLTQTSVTCSPETYLATTVTNLRKLQAVAFLPNWRLPHLCKLTLGLDETAAKLLIANLVQFISKFPSLRILYIRRDYASKARALGPLDVVNANLEALFEHCAQRSPDLCVYFVDLHLEVGASVSRLQRRYPWVTILSTGYKGEDSYAAFEF